ncbi:MAG: low specificity L-threonine aldolase, partial [Anaerolineae bacterium]|nr:low specificity L-threonine aldolase [Anaerolineae bacterium]
AIAEMPGLEIDPRTVQTNIVIFEVTHPGLSPAEISQRLLAEGVRINPIEARKLRAVTHYGIERAHVEEAIRALRRVVSGRA